jgi:hypothetical protein
VFTAEPVCSWAHFPCASCLRDRGCSAHPAFPAPSSLSEGKRNAKPRAISAARRLVAVIRDQEDWRDWTVHVSDSDDEIFVLPFAFVLGKPH